MGRTIIGEELIEQKIAGLFGTREWIIGLIVGQVTPQKDYAVHIVRTPDPEDSPHEGGKKKAKAPPGLQSIEDSWVASHAKQVRRMLPGGLEILGVFTMAPADMLKNSQTKLRQTLFAVQKMLVKSQATVSNSSAPGLERVLLQMCTSSRKLTCRTIDVADPQSTFTPAEWKYQKFVHNWHKLQTSLAVDLTINIPMNSLSQNLNKQIQAGLAPFWYSIWHAIGLIDHCLLPKEQLLDSTVLNLKKKQKKQSSKESTSTGKTSQTFIVQLLTQMPVKHGKDDEASVTGCGAKMLIRGVIQGGAFVHNRSTVGQALQALKLDLIRSLMSRCELLCEDMLQTEEEQDPKILYETPRRVFSSLPGTPLGVCDYPFHDESVQDCLSRFNELLDLQLTEDDVDMECEKIPDDQDLIKPERTLKRPDLDHVPRPFIKKKSNRDAYMGMAVSIGCAFLATLLAYICADYFE